MRVSVIVAIARNRAIGLKNKLIYWLPNDLKRFKALTTGHTIIMGRKTFESLPKGALPNRRNIVLTRSTSANLFPGADVFRNLDEALDDCRRQGTDEVYIIGGASVYHQALPLADRLCLTCIDDEPAEADTFFPKINADEWEEVFREEHPVDEKHNVPYAFVDLVRINR